MPSIDVNRGQRLQNFLLFQEFCSYVTFKNKVYYKTHIDWHNWVTNVRLFALGPVTDRKKDLFALGPVTDRKKD